MLASSTSTPTQRIPLETHHGRAGSSWRELSTSQRAFAICALMNATASGKRRMRLGEQRLLDHAFETEARRGARLGAARCGPDDGERVACTRSGSHTARARVGTNGLELVRTTVPGSAALADRPDLPSRLRTYYTLARTSDGAYHLVQRRALITVAPSPAFVLEFDRVLGDQG
jgi:hypothetical protein